MKPDILITVAGWEERFWLGVEAQILNAPPRKVLMYYYEEYANATSVNRERVAGLCEKEKIALEPKQLRFKQPEKSWMRIYESMRDVGDKCTSCVVQVTTMPRETIWTVLNLLEEQCERVEYLYESPKAYGKEWLSRDPEKPRIVYKLGGIAKLGAPTKLLVLTGYDVERVQQLIDFFEPEQVLLGVQAGEQLENKSRNIEKHERFRKEWGVEMFEVDAYGNDCGTTQIQNVIGPVVESANVVMSSLGPKVSAIALYRLHKRYPQTALAYTPSREYNLEYSCGIGREFRGMV